MDRVRVIKYTLVLALIAVLAPAVSAQQLLKNSSPNEYVVKKGDTLWDIAGVFLKSPWKWKSIWQQNDQIKNPDLIYPNDTIYLHYKDGKPYLSKTKNSSANLSPKIRVANKFSPITAIPKNALKAFINDRRIVEADRINKMPYILSSVSLRQLISKGDEVYIRGNLDPLYNQYHIYRKGNVYGAAQGLLNDNVEIFKVGSLNVIEKKGEISRAEIISAKGVIRKNDFIVRPQELGLKPLYYLAAAPEHLTGKILTSISQTVQVSLHDGVVIDLGKNSGLYPGHVFNVSKAGVSIKDPRTNEMIEIDSTVVAEVMVVNVFENLSYGIILSATGIVSPGDVLTAVK